MSHSSSARRTPLIYPGYARNPVFYLGTHQVNWLADSMARLFVSHRRLSPRRALPRALTNWALDSGGFSELTLYGGWRTTPAEYNAAVRRYDVQIGNLDWAAPMDMMCEDSMLALTGLTVADHQQATVDNFAVLQHLWQANPNPDRPECPYMPVLQGQTAKHYHECWDRYEDAGIDLRNYPLVGVGSVCRRQHSEEIREILMSLHERDSGVELHGFGIKVQGLTKYGHLLRSADTMAWSYTARRNSPLEGCTHQSCSSCRKYAMQWRRRIVASSCTQGHGVECDGSGECWRETLRLATQSEPPATPEPISR